MRIFLIFISVLFAANVFAQTFFRNSSKRTLTFREIQLQFDEFKKTHDLQKEKHWKSFKRYEADMQLHTNGRGEPAGFDDYIREAIRVAEEKKQNSSAGVWSPFGPSAIPNNLTGYMENGIGRVNCVAFHPTNTSTFFVGVAQGGLWKTTNGGASYTCLTENLPITRISDIAIDPINPNTMYISVCDFEYIGVGLYLNGRKRHTHYGLGIYKTTDGGLTWNPTGLTFQLTNGDASLMRKVVIDPSNTNQLLACGVSGMYKSTNGGTSWTKTLDSLFWDMQQDPVNPNTIYAATGWVGNSNIGNAAIYKSTNFGASWTMLNTGIPLQGTVQRVKLAIAPNDNNFIYAATVDNSGGLYGLYKSVNAGATWSLTFNGTNLLEAGQGTNPGGQGNYDLGLCVNPSDKNTIYIGGVNLWMSSDGAATFDPVSHWTTNYGATLHGDIHMIARQPGTPYYFVCSDGGIYKSSNIQPGDWIMNWPTVWWNLGNGMQVTSFYRLSSSKNSAGRIVAGAQDNATFYYNGSTWSTIFGGDGMDNYIDPAGTQEIVGSSQYGNFFYSNDDGQTGNYTSSNPNNEAAEWVTPVACDPNSSSVIYIGNENVVKSTDGGQNWAALGTIYTNTNTSQNTEISALAVAKTNSNVIYAARRVRYEFGLNGIVFRSTNGGTSFTNITSNLPDTLYYTGIEVSESSANEAAVCMAGFAAGCKVFRTTNGGSSWTNISYNLPNIPVNCIKYVPGSGQIMVATDLGIYILNNGATTWTSYSLGLPNVITSDIEFNVAMNKIYVSTFGRGIWETSLSLVTSVAGKGFAASLDFNVYPAVNKGKFTIEIPGGFNGKIIIVNVLGQLVYETAAKEKALEVSLDVAPGAYYVKLDDGVAVGVKKIIVE